MGKYNEALNYFDKTLQLDKQNLIALSYKGETLRKMTNYQESLVYFDKALEINPKNLDSLFGKGDSLRCLRRNDEALYVLLQGEQIDPNIVWFKSKFSLQNFGSNQYELDSKLMILQFEYLKFKNNLQLHNNASIQFSKGICMINIKVTY